MKEFSDSLIYRRHSMRRYTQESISADQVDHILHAAMAAPSANNAQPWEFILIDDSRILEKIAGFHPYANMMRTATLAIVPCVQVDVAKRNRFYPQDMGACVQNMLLAATECGLGSCWCGVHPVKKLEKKFIDLLGIPENAFPFAVVAFGHPAGSPMPSSRYDESRVHRNSRW